jgi:hypothetical protein
MAVRREIRREGVTVRGAQHLSINALAFPYADLDTRPLDLGTARTFAPMAEALF